MNKKQYVEKYGYIFNNDFKRALEQVRDLGINIQDWKLEPWKKLTEKNITLMKELRLHLKYNCWKTYKNNFWNMYALPRDKGINYTGNSSDWNGSKFSGDYKYCMNKSLKPISIEGEDLYFIPGSYSIYSVTSCLEEDVARVISTNPSWWSKDVTPIKITAYEN